MPTNGYYQVMGEIFGPVSPAEMRRLAAEGVITRDTLVRKGEDGEWVLADRVRGLFDKQGNSTPPAAATTRVSTASKQNDSHASSESTWYIQSDNSADALLGPLSSVEIKARIRNGTITAKTLLRRIDGKWIPLSKIEVFRDEVALKDRAAGTALVMVVVVILLFITMARSNREPSEPETSRHDSPSPSEYFGSDEERLEWRSKNRLPMTQEDIGYEQRKLLDQFRKVKASQQKIR